MSSKTLAEQLAKAKPDETATLFVTLETPDGKKLNYTYHRVSIEQWAGVIRGLELITKEQR